MSGMVCVMCKKIEMERPSVSDVMRPRAYLGIRDEVMKWARVK